MREWCLCSIRVMSDLRMGMRTVMLICYVGIIGHACVSKIENS